MSEPGRYRNDPSTFHAQQYGTPAQWAPPPQHAAVQPYSPPEYPAHQPQPAALAYRPGTVPPLVSAGGRLGAVLLDVLLAVLTLWIGWFIWALITWSDGQTPAKKLLGHVVADPQTGLPFDWGRMALREFCVKGLLGSVLNICTFGIYFWVDSLMILGDGQRTLHDRMAGSVVRHADG
uniref:RDD family protein n=1 Tax=Paractinoplanes polyasparticus TaxID=2856853 RepID=UPI001C85725C|nr:RDD family protein [Actinoplanes polyasparticus]